MVAYSELKSVLGNCAIVVVVNPIVVLPIPAFTPVKSTLPIPFVPIPVKSVLISILSNLITPS